MNIAVVDDIQFERDRLNAFINRYFEKSSVNLNTSFYTSGEQLLQRADLRSLDIAFIDILMDDMSGIELAKTIRQVNCRCLIVLNSGSKDFICESYDIRAFYYMIKPYEYDTFEKVMKMAEKKLVLSGRGIEIITNRKKVRLNTDEILFVDKCRNSVQYHLKNEQFSSRSLSFREVEDILMGDSKFIKCFQCVIVNLRHVNSIEDKRFVFLNGEWAPISRVHLVEARERYDKYLEQHLVFK